MAVMELNIFREPKPQFLRDKFPRQMAWVASGILSAAGGPLPRSPIIIVDRRLACGIAVEIGRGKTGGVRRCRCRTKGKVREAVIYLYLSFSRFPRLLRLHGLQYELRIHENCNTGDVFGEGTIHRRSRQCQDASQIPPGQIKSR